MSRKSIIYRYKADVNRAHGHDNISVRIIKLCSNFFVHPLTLIFQNSLAAVKFTAEWSRAILYCLNPYYRQYLFCLNVVKFFEKLIFNELFKFFQDKNLLSKHQSGFYFFFSILTTFQLLTLAVCSLTYVKSFIKFDTMDYDLNWSKMVLVEIYFN